MTIEDIALQMTPGIGVKGAVHLLGIFGDARGIFAAAPEELAMKAALREDIPEYRPPQRLRRRRKGTRLLPPQFDLRDRFDRPRIPGIAA